MAILPGSDYYSGLQTHVHASRPSPSSVPFTLPPVTLAEHLSDPVARVFGKYLFSFAYRLNSHHVPALIVTLPICPLNKHPTSYYAQTHLVLSCLLSLFMPFLQPRPTPLFVPSSPLLSRASLIPSWASPQEENLLFRHLCFCCIYCGS